ncbi:MAG TPA: hypothetical protein VGM30_09540 [Puia sp.]|jgi:hypothetical protein
MKKHYLTYPFWGFILVLTAAACHKAIPDVDQDPGFLYHNFRPGSIRRADSSAKKQDTVIKVDTTKPVAPYPQVPINGCAYSPYYGDTIIFDQPTSGSDYIVNPVNNPGAGKFLSWPVGLSLDSLTGAIDMTKSETGLKYAIGFVKNGTTDTCLQTLVLGGVSYEDSIYVLAQGQTQAAPYYDANPYLPPVCNGQGGGSGCTFDVNGAAAAMKVIVDKNTGVIDLKKTLNGGLLGGAFGLIPLNGNTVTTTIYYRLNDASNNALQHIDVQLVYYSSKSLINSGLLGNVLNKLDNLLSGHLISNSINPRPPLVIIVSHN